MTVLVTCHTRELAFQISKEYERFSKYMPGVKVGSLTSVTGCGGRGGQRRSVPQVSVFFRGLSIKKDGEVLKKQRPHVMSSLSLRGVRHFVLDQCDRMLEQLGVQRRELGAPPPPRRPPAVLTPAASLP